MPFRERAIKNLILQREPQKLCWEKEKPTRK